MMTGSMVSDPLQSYLKKSQEDGGTLPTWGQNIIFNGIARSHFPLQNKPNYINVQYRTVPLDTAECFPRRLSRRICEEDSQNPS